MRAKLLRLRIPPACFSPISESLERSVKQWFDGDESHLGHCRLLRS
jgi:hypothetical protein